jgi:hypothetical protein
MSAATARASLFDFPSTAVRYVLSAPSLSPMLDLLIACSTAAARGELLDFEFVYQLTLVECAQAMTC